MEKIHFKQAELWLIGADNISNQACEGIYKYPVATAMVIHAIIKANDALCLKFLKITPKRHDEAKKLFNNLVKNKFVSAEYSNYGRIIQDAISSKAKAEYRAGFFSKKDFEDMKRKAERFLEMTGKIIQ